MQYKLFRYTLHTFNHAKPKKKRAKNHHFYIYTSIESCSSLLVSLACHALFSSQAMNEANAPHTLLNENAEQANSRRT